MIFVRQNHFLFRYKFQRKRAVAARVLLFIFVFIDIDLTTTLPVTTDSVSDQVYYSTSLQLSHKKNVPKL